MADTAYDDDWGLRPRRGRGLGRWIGLILGLLILGVIAAVLLNGPAIDGRPNDHKVIRVALPPPPPAPPPKPLEKPPEPKPLPKEVEQPQPQPVPQPTPPTPQAPTPAASDALTARTGAGPSNYGLAQGAGAGHIGGGNPGNGSAFVAYGEVALNDIRRAAQADPTLKRGYRVEISVKVAPEGRITSVRIIKGSGDPQRDQALQKRLTGLQLSQRPPEGMPAFVHVELDTGSGS